MTQAALLFIGGLATLATLGLFVDFRSPDGSPDKATQVLVPFLAAIFWGTFGLSASDVIVRSTSFADASEPIEPLFWLGIVMAILLALYAIHELFFKTYEEVTESNGGLLP